MLVSSHITAKARKGVASGIEGRGLAALAPISAGEELTTDYALFDDHDGTMECRCGAPSCRATVSGRDWQRPDLQRKYGSCFSSYLLRRLPH